MDKPQYPSQFPQPSGPAPNPAPQQVPNPYGQAPAGGGYPPPQNPSGENQLGMIAMICGLLSLIMGCPLSIAAIILGFIGMKKEPKGMATAGLVLGIVTATLQLVALCFVVAIYGLFFGALAAGAAGIAAMVPYAATESAFQRAASSIEAHHDATGAYPNEAEGTGLVQGTTDGWNHQIVYRLDGEEYILVSPGPDGILDNEDDEEFYAYEYVPPGSYGEPDPDSPTQRAMALASEAVEENLYESDAYLYPADGEGQSLVAGFTDEWGSPIVYRQVDGGDGYLVISPGPDRTLETPDDMKYNGYEWTGEIPTPAPAEPATSDDSRVSSATEREILKACDIVQEHYESSGEFVYPSDEEGQALIDHLTDEWGNPLVYRQTEGGDWVNVLSKGPDGMLGTLDDLNSEAFYDP
ncbi:MAG TPA: hypothetical protein VGN57_10255 [Pirellulaceae bacterium]|jgi:hypothetical protein|nr:hypothetical protein [Pirellulaceae bacterium]